MQISSGSFLQQVGLFDCDAGDSVSLSMAEAPSNSGNPWYVEICAVLAEGEYLIGAMYTATNLQPIVGGSYLNNRVIAVCSVPGARTWIARFQNPTQNLIAQVYLASTKCCTGPAWQPLEGYAIDRFNAGGHC